MLCYVSSENAGSQEKMQSPKCQWRHFVLPAFSLAFWPAWQALANCPIYINTVKPLYLASPLI